MNIQSIWLLFINDRAILNDRVGSDVIHLKVVNFLGLKKSESLMCYLLIQDFIIFD